MLKENTLFGVRDKIKTAMDRLQAFEPSEGYYLAFSGGKDSQCIYHLAKEAGVKFDAHYHVTGIDPPELVYFIKQNYPEVKREMYKESIWELILKKGVPPTRLMRYCCQELKEHGGEDRICITGIRHAESVKRSKRKPFEVIAKERKEGLSLFNDNSEGRMLFENCQLKGKRVINPIIDWEETDVWEYLNSNDLAHCSLYDEGWNRIGCIGCPMARTEGRKKEFARWPKFYEQYIRTFDKLVKLRKEKGMSCTWNNGEELMSWWLDEKNIDKQLENQISMF